VNDAKVHFTVLDRFGRVYRHISGKLEVADDSRKTLPAIPATLAVAIRAIAVRKAQ
jgi:hypothetical protein